LSAILCSWTSQHSSSGKLTLGKTLGGPEKREGDNRAPAGVFRLSQATGYAEAPAGARIKYRRASAALRCVDDPASPSYNQLVEAPTLGKTAWASDEPMLRTDGMYALAIVVDHNRDPVEPGAGSCIFIHPWVTAGVPSPGCTMLARAPVERLVRWLDPAAHPLLVQLPRTVSRAVGGHWALPRDDGR
jgi:L,D-peptidoglycan transpeptidase YkuD (ErfK/YbiS/YcfS/YnhG family)